MSLLWVLLDTGLNLLVGMLCGTIAGRVHRLWVGFALYDSYILCKAVFYLIEHDFNIAIDLLINAILIAILTFITWWKERKNRRKKRNLLGLLGYKARAARAKLLAHIPRGGRNPGLSPA